MAASDVAECLSWSLHSTDKDWMNCFIFKFKLLLSNFCVQVHISIDNKLLYSYFTKERQFEMIHEMFFMWAMLR